MSTVQFDIEEELKKLPDKPGVYIMHDRDDNIIYVGKAVILKNRVRSYFRESTNKTAKIQTMVKKIAWFEYIVTASELEHCLPRTYPAVTIYPWEPFLGILRVQTVKPDPDRDI